MKSNHEALERAEEQVEQAVNPQLRENRHAEAHAQRQARRRGTALSQSGAQGNNANPVASEGSDQVARGDFIEFDDQDSDLIVATDVSFPVEIQSGDAMADQLRKLNQLLEQGVLTEEEYAVAKAKLLS